MRPFAHIDFHFLNCKAGFGLGDGQYDWRAGRRNPIPMLPYVRHTAARIRKRGGGNVKIRRLAADSYHFPNLPRIKDSANYIAWTLETTMEGLFWLG